MPLGFDRDYVHGGDVDYREQRRRAEVVVQEAVVRLRDAFEASGIECRTLRAAGTSMNRPPRVFLGTFSPEAASKLAEALEKAAKD